MARKINERQPYEIVNQIHHQLKKIKNFQDVQKLQYLV